MSDSNEYRGLRVGVVGLPGAWSTEALADALEAKTGFRLVVDVANISADLARGKVMVDGVDLCELDGLMIKKIGKQYSPDMLDRLEILRFVEARGVKIFSNPLSILRLMDRLSCTVTMAGAGIPMPPTTITEDPHHAVAAIEGYGAAVLKPLYSTKARGMTIIEAGPDALAQVQAYQAAGNPMLYVQQRLDLPDRDLGVVFIGGEYVGTYARVASGSSWNTTTRDGGKYAPHEPSAAVIALARRAGELFGLSFTSVDVVEMPDGPLVFEVSAFGGFRGLKEGLGIDGAARYALHALQTIAGDH